MIVCIGDTHFPFVSWKALDKVIAYIKQTKPAMVIQMGDLYDMYSWSKFPRTHGVITPHQELIRGARDAERMWADVKKASPKSKLIQLTGNHDVRPHKRLLENYAPLEPLLNLREIFNFADVETLHDQTEFIYDNVCYMHGFRKHGDHMRHNRMSTVCGHLHIGGTVFGRLGKRVIWELNAGYVGNPYSEAMSYGKQRTFATWTHGCAVVDENGPRFIPIDGR